MLELFANDFVNDGDFNFEDFEFRLVIKDHRVGEPEVWLKEQDELALYIFDQLKLVRKYHIMMVDDLEYKIAEFIPPV